MFDIGWSEILVIAVVAVVVIGPKDLPRALRTVGQWTGKVRRMARDFQSQFNEVLREAELDDVKKEVESAARMEPLSSVRKEAQKVQADIKAGLEMPADADLGKLKSDANTAEPAPVIAADSKP